MSVVAVVFARAGSKGVPDKNLRVVGGRPLVAWAVDVARQVGAIDRVLVSTDSPRIAEAAAAAGAEVPFLRPESLAGDTSPEWLSWRHALHHLREADGHLPELLVSVPTTSPLRSAGDVSACISAARDADWDAVITVTPAQRSPYFNMVSIDDSGRAAVAWADVSGPTRRQDAPVLYDVCTVAYAARPEYVLSADGLFAGRVGAVVVAQERSLDIDTEHDLHVADLLLRHR